MGNRWVFGSAAVVSLMVGAMGRLAADVPLPPQSDVGGSHTVPMLQSLFARDFLIGTALDFRHAAEFSPQELEMITSQFNVITPENSMKPASIHPEEKTWRWTTADTLVNFCESHHMQVVGHTLVWHQQTPDWFFKGENEQPVTRDVAIARLKEHVETEVGHFKGKLKGWDVVNEAISDNGDGKSETLRDTPWLRAIGPAYLTYAYQFAHEADPQVELYYNDYNIERETKHQSSLLLVKRLMKEGIPLTAVGIQGHWSLKYLPLKELEKAIEDYAALGLKVNITELDIGIEGNGGGQLTTPGEPKMQPAAGPTLEQLQSQADAYRKFFELFERHKQVIDRVTFWGVNDRRSWRKGLSPLLFDDNNQPKPAFTAVVGLKTDH